MGITTSAFWGCHVRPHKGAFGLPLGVYQLSPMPDLRHQYADEPSAGERFPTQTKRRGDGMNKERRVHLKLLPVRYNVVRDAAAMTNPRSQKTTPPCFRLALRMS